MRKQFLIIYFLSIAFSLKAQQEWKLCVQMWTFHKSSFLEALDKIKQLDFQYIEAYPGQKVGEGFNGPFSYNLSQTERKKLRRLLKEKGIKILAYGVVDKGYYTKNDLEKYFAFCRDMQIPLMTAEPEWEDLDWFNELSEKYKVKVGIHCHPKPSSHYWHPDSILKAMQNRKNIVAWPDVAHWARNGVNTVEGLEKMEGKLWGMHFKDIVRFDDVKANDTLFGKGVANLPAVLKELKRQNFKGVISLEYEANEDNNMDDMWKNIEFYKSEMRKLELL
jgi:sugar phosphate isomerase/epimerase